MIKIDFATAVALYLSFFGVGILFIWLYLDRNRFKKYSSDDVYFWQCAVCTHAYVDSVHNKISVCPVCGSYNKREDKK